MGHVLALFKKRLIIRGGIAGKVASVCYKRAVREKHIYAGIKGGAFKLVDVQRNHLTAVEIVVDRKQLADGAELFYFIVEFCGYFIIKGGDIFPESIKASLLFIGNYSIVLPHGQGYHNAGYADYGEQLFYLVHYFHLIYFFAKGNLPIFTRPAPIYTKARKADCSECRGKTAAQIKLCHPSLYI